MPRNAIGLKIVARQACFYDGMKKNRRLSDAGLLQILSTAREHNVADAIAENIVCLLKKVVCES